MSEESEDHQLDITGKKMFELLNSEEPGDRAKLESVLEADINILSNADVDLEIVVKRMRHWMYLILSVLKEDSYE